MEEEKKIETSKFNIGHRIKLNSNNISIEEVQAHAKANGLVMLRGQQIKTEKQFKLIVYIC